MATFTENSRTWEIDITVLDVKKLREQTEPPIKLTDPEVLSNLFDDECQQYEVLWLLLEEQAKAYDVDAKQFAKIFTSNFVPATTALVTALKVFFQNCGRVELSSVIEKTLHASKRLRGLVETTLSSDRMNTLMDQVIQKEMERVDKYMTKTEAEVAKMNTEQSGSSLES